MLPPGTVLAPQALWTIVAASGLEQTGDQKRASLSGKCGLPMAPLLPSGAPGALAVQAWEELGLAEGAMVLPLISLGRPLWNWGWAPPTSEQPGLS